MLHFEVLAEEPSMEAFLNIVMPKILGDKATFLVHVYRGKPDLLKRLGERLRGYNKWIPNNFRIVVLLDRDNDDCEVLKKRMENEASAIGLVSKSKDPTNWRLVNRIVIEELEAWYFGEWSAVQAAYAGLPDVTSKQPYRSCDQIQGGTWEAFQRVLQSRNIYQEVLLKVEAAQAVAMYFDPDECRSPSFKVFKNALLQQLSMS